MNGKAGYLFFLLLMSLVWAPAARAQDFSSYRSYAFGMSMDALRTQLDSQELQTEVIQESPVLLQEVTWWPWQATGSPAQTQGLWRVLFRFQNDQLYRIVTTYDRRATRGLTVDDMIDVISDRYGTATRPQADVSFPTFGSYRSTERILAQWENSEYSFTLFRSSLSGAFGLIMYSKQLNARAGLPVAESARLAVNAALLDELALSSQNTIEREAIRTKNKALIRP